MKLIRLSLWTLALALLSGTSFAQVTGTGPGERPATGYEFTKIGPVSEAQPLVIEENGGLYYVRVNVQTLGGPFKVFLVKPKGTLITDLTLEGPVALEGFVLRPGEKAHLIIGRAAPQPRRPPVFVGTAKPVLGSAVNHAGFRPRKLWPGELYFTEAGDVTNEGAFGFAGPAGWSAGAFTTFTLFKPAVEAPTPVLAWAHFLPIGSEDDLPRFKVGTVFNAGPMTEEEQTLYRAKVKNPGVTNEGAVRPTEPGIRLAKVKGSEFTNEGPVKPTEPGVHLFKVKGSGFTNEGAVKPTGPDVRLFKVKGFGFTNEGAIKPTEPDSRLAKVANPGVVLGAPVKHISVKPIPPDAGAKPVDGTKEVGGSVGGKPLAPIAGSIH